MTRDRIADLILRAGVAFAFLFPALDAIADPDSWIGYFPKFMHGLAPDLVLLHAFGAVEVALALWILSGRRIVWPSLIAALMLVGIVAFNLAQFQIVFRDLAIAAAALALALRASARR